MAKQIKPVSLLSPNSATRQATVATKPRHAAAEQAPTNPQSAEAHNRSVVKQLSAGILMTCIFSLILIPKPELIVYRQLNIQASSIYWPGIFGLGAGLTDSQMQVYLDDDRHEMRLCYTDEPTVQCSKYQITSRGGLIEVGKYLLSMN